MIESTFHHATNNWHDILLYRGTACFGPPSEVIERKIRAITAPFSLQELIERVPLSEDWDELLMPRWRQDLRRAIRESTTFQAMIEKGRIKERQNMLLHLGTKRFGTASDDVLRKIQRFVDLERRWVLIDNLDHAANWEELLNSP